MKFTRTLSGRLLLALSVTVPTVFLFTLDRTVATPVPQPPISKPADTINLKKPSLDFSSKAMAQLVQLAKDDPKFFRALVSDPQPTLAKVNYLDQGSKAALATLNPQELSLLMKAAVQDCGVTVVCGGTCTFTSKRDFAHTRLIIIQPAQRQLIR